MTSEEFAKLVKEELKRIETMLLEKNRQYGNSALDPIRIFSSANTVEQLYVRIDDKLSRVKRGTGGNEDHISDLQGYFVLLKIALNDANPEWKK